MNPWGDEFHGVMIFIWGSLMIFMADDFHMGPRTPDFRHLGVRLTEMTDLSVRTPDFRASERQSVR